MQTCPTCGVPVKLKGASVAVPFFGNGSDIVPQYEPLTETDAVAALGRFHVMLKAVKSALASNSLTDKAKLDIVESECNRIKLDLPPPEPEIAKKKRGPVPDEE